MLKKLSLIILLAFPVSAHSTNLDLTCEGNSTKELSGSNVTTNSDGSANVTNYSRGILNYHSLVKVHFRDGNGTIELPTTMTPKMIIPFKKQKTVWDLENIRETGEKFTAKVKYEPLSSANIDIDRITGSIEISGFTTFFGKCAAYNMQDIQKAF